MRMRLAWPVAAGGSALLFLAMACHPAEDLGPRFGGSMAAARQAAVPLRAAAQLYPVAPPPFSADVFPCSQCHSPGDVVNRTPHPVEFHEDIVLRHDEKNRWCLDCHDARHRDMLHLADARLVPFTESYRLCGQCHGPTLRNWKAGEHGKRTGSWLGDKQYLLCANCHSPHAPHFKPIPPKPAPLRQEAVR